MRLLTAIFFILSLIQSSFSQNLNDVSIKTDKGEQLYCKKGPSKKHLFNNEDESCPFYSCSGVDDTKVLAMIPSDLLGSEPVFIKLKGDKTEVVDSAFSVFEQNDDVPIFVMPDFLEDVSSVEDIWSKRYLVPPVYHNNLRALEFLTDPTIEKRWESASKSCANNSEVAKLLSAKKVVSKKNAC